MIRPNNALTKESMEKNKLKLNIWNNDIKIAIKQNKLAHKQWKEAGNQSVLEYYQHIDLPQ
jgi:hypothetical protein